MYVVLTTLYPDNPSHLGLARDRARDPFAGRRHDRRGHAHGGLRVGVPAAACRRARPTRGGLAAAGELPHGQRGARGGRGPHGGRGRPGRRGVAGDPRRVGRGGEPGRRRRTGLGGGPLERRRRRRAGAGRAPSDRRSPPCSRRGTAAGRSGRPASPAGSRSVRPTGARRPDRDRWRARAAVASTVSMPGSWSCSSWRPRDCARSASMSRTRCTSTRSTTLGPRRSSCRAGGTGWITTSTSGPTRTSPSTRWRAASSCGARITSKPTSDLGVPVTRRGHRAPPRRRPAHGRGAPASGSTSRPAPRSGPTTCGRASSSSVIAAPGSTALAVDAVADQLVVGFDDGRIATVDLDGGRAGRGRGRPRTRRARPAGPRHRAPAGDGRRRHDPGRVRGAPDGPRQRGRRPRSGPSTCRASPISPRRARVRPWSACRPPSTTRVGRGDARRVARRRCRRLRGPPCRRGRPGRPGRAGRPGQWRGPDGCRGGDHGRPSGRARDRRSAPVAVATDDGVTFVDPATAGVSEHDPDGAAARTGWPWSSASTIPGCTSRTARRTTRATRSWRSVATAPRTVRVSNGPSPPARARDAVAYDDATQQVHILGLRPGLHGRPRPDGWTVYVVEPHGNAVYADAALPPRA